MSLFKNRQEAGKRLAELLLAYRGMSHAVVVGLARGGIVVASEVARLLALPLSVAVPRKIGAPGNPELALGALSSDGEVWINPDVQALVRASACYIAQQVAREKEIASARIALYTQGAPLPSLRGTCVLLIDDGVATGATLIAEMGALRRKGAAKLIAAAPVAARPAWEEIARIADEAVCLEIAEGFLGISSFYEEFLQVDDETVVQLLKEGR
jgi:putative phosphoribosyl transferase